MFKEFKEFAVRGNVLDLAVGVIIGLAFGAMVNSAVNDVIMPPIGQLIGKVDFKDLFLSLDGRTFESLAKAKEAGAPVIAYGQFFNTVLNFFIVSFIIFLAVRHLKRLEGPAPAAPATKECPYCANSIPAKAVRCGFCTADLRA